MKMSFVIVILFFSCVVYTQDLAALDTDNDLVFIHHSVGNGWLDNSLHAELLTKYYIDERNDIFYETDFPPDSGRPDSLAPVPGDTMNMCHWVLWFSADVLNLLSLQITLRLMGDIAGNVIG